MNHDRTPGNVSPTRRTVLRAAGATLFLPFLPSALPRSAWAAATPAPTRLVVCVVPNGIYSPAWTPLLTGAGYDLPEILLPLAALQSRFTVVSGTKNKSEEAVYPEHDNAMGSLLTDTPVPTDNSVVNGMSFDQIAADAFGANTPFRSMQLGVNNTGSKGHATFLGEVSWAAQNTPLPPIVDPRTAFDRMFGTTEGLTEEEIAGRKTIRTSILDRVLDRTTSLKTGLSTRDVEKLDQYETAVRELELQIERLENIDCPVPEAPTGNPAFGESTGLMYDLMKVALECDLTRYVTFMQGPSLSTQTYTHLGLIDTDHQLSHAAWYDDAKRPDRILMQSWQVEQFAAFVQSLADTTDSDGSDVLSNTICVFTSEFGNANDHTAYGDSDVPIGIAGGESSGIVQGLHRRVADQSHANVWLALLHHLGIDQSSFGTFSTGPIDLSV